jgi:hypothetical protein
VYFTVSICAINPPIGPIILARFVLVQATSRRC